MKIYQLNGNSSNYMTPYFEPNNVLKKRVGIKFLFNTTPKSYSEDWEPLELSIKACDSAPVIPTLSRWQNYLVLHASAYKVLESTLNPFGEFLPCTYQGTAFYLFNPLTIAEDLDAVIADSVTRNGNLLSGIAFNQEKLEGVPVFRTKESNISNYCTEAFKEIVESEKLDGLIFSSNLTHD
ncbi:hypothetical protein [Microbulbifer okhotskensis]|uniref:hypothetical protein n=1 Tax=Microbulbifer okhotskensis TaxID=2926617 RepID=UPI00207CF28D|nr:hypothetical protein [Microbulbifer okhotskensis]